MFGLGKSAQQKRIDELAADNRQLERDYLAAFERERGKDMTIGALRTEIDSLRESSFGADRTAAMYKRLYEGACKTLSQIAGQETPTGNATVKRMARMARAELPLLHHEAPKNGAAGAVAPSFPIPGSAADVSPPTHRTIS